MAKTKPIGVRFDENILEVFKEDGIAKTPQKTLNFLTQFYLDNRSDKNHFTETFNTSKFFKNSKITLPNDVAFERKINEDYIESVMLGMPTQSILDEIKQVEAEKIPKERDTPFGRKIWSAEQSKKIINLKNKLQ